jgi:hypothetical protein
VALTDDLERIANAAQGRAEAGERITGVLAAAPQGFGRIYLCAYDSGSWLAFDEAEQPVSSERALRDAAQLAAVCELAADLAGGDDLADLQLRLHELRERERPPGIEEAIVAAQAVADALADVPRVATIDFLDRVGALQRELERALGTDSVAPFATALQQAMPAAAELADDVARNYKGALA